MALNIGFMADFSAKKKNNENTYASKPHKTTPRKSMVQVYFPKKGMTLSYYNDKFDLHCDDIVYVEGKLEGLRGYVTEVNYNFKIKLSDYKRVIAVVDTDVKGQFFMAGSHFVTFDRSALPSSKAATWFNAPKTDEDEFISGSDNTSFFLDDLKGMNVDSGTAERGYNYYCGNKVKYLSIDGTKGYAIVEGTHNYEVEFKFVNGEISCIVCSCYCSYNCKHEFAAMLQLKETLGLITKNYDDEYAKTGYFAAISKGTLFSMSIDKKEIGSFVL